MKVIMRDIEMIAYFQPGKPPKPIKFRINNDDEGKSVVYIDMINNLEQERKAGIDTIRYTCQGLINKQARVFEIMYEVHTFKWILTKI